jgi:hypothetical protein
MAKLLKSRWLWYPLVALFVFVAAGYSSNFITAQQRLSQTEYISLRIPWILVESWVARSTDKDEFYGTYDRRFTWYYLCLFGQAILLDETRTYVPMIAK